MPINKHIQLFTGNAHPELAQSISKVLDIPLSKTIVGEFANGETRVELLDNCRGCDAFIIQPVCRSGKNSVNDNLMELHVIASALHVSSATRITAVMPIYGYARQDKKDRSRAAITAGVIAKHLEADGINRVIVLDLHASQIQGFFDIPVDNLYAENLLLEHLKGKNVGTDFVIVSPDAGGSGRAIRVSQKLGTTYAIISKNRRKVNEVERMDLVGDVKGKIAIIVDDMADTCGTLVRASDLLQQKGAVTVHAFVTHGVFSEPAMERLNNCVSLKSVVVTNTIPQKDNQRRCKKIEVVDIAPLLGEVIKRTHNEESISELFK